MSCCESIRGVPFHQSSIGRTTVSPHGEDNSLESCTLTGSPGDDLTVGLGNSLGRYADDEK